ncbi:hypothetical protein EAG_09659 [Camponotus floridanus]|uniref:Uncharacterized protein n=1 Tax=Camponotus floridanus TaxID=104421 RepID=E2AC52_CAMFO|nr:hypothetical protein EAG_09659 [Camponotus floridanus]
MKFRGRSEKAKWMLQCAYEVLIRHINQCYRETGAAPLHFWERILPRDTRDERLLGERLVYPPRPQDKSRNKTWCYSSDINLYTNRLDIFDFNGQAKKNRSDKKIEAGRRTFLETRP